MINKDILSACGEALSSVKAQAENVFLHLELGDASIGYIGHETTVADIKQFFSGHCDFSQDQTAGTFISLTTETDLLVRLEAEASFLPEDPDLRYLELWNDDKHALIRKDMKGFPSAYYYLVKAEKTLLVICSPDPLVMREHSVEVIRSVLKWQLLEQGWLPFHAGCCSLDTSGVCMLAGKAGGKTTTLLNLMARNGYSLLGADKMMIRDSGNGIEVCGQPGKLGMRLAPVAAQPKIMYWLSKHEDEAYFASTNLSAQKILHLVSTTPEIELRTLKQKVRLLPAEIADIFATTVSKYCQLEYFLLPTFKPEEKESKLQEIKGEEIMDLLLDRYIPIGSKGENYLQHFYAIENSDCLQRLKDLLEKYVSTKVPAYILVQNANTNDQSARLVQNLLAPPSLQQAGD